MGRLGLARRIYFRVRFSNAPQKTMQMKIIYKHIEKALKERARMSKIKRIEVGKICLKSIFENIKSRIQLNSDNEKKC